MSLIAEVKRVLDTTLCRRQGNTWQFAKVLRATLDKDNVLVVVDMVGPDRTVIPWLWAKTESNVFGSDKFDQGTWFVLTAEAEIELFGEGAGLDLEPFVSDKDGNLVDVESAQIKHPALNSPMEHRRLGYKDAEAQAMSPEEYTRVITGKVRKEK